MANYIIFTNIYNKPANIRYFKNQNYFKTFYAATKEEVKNIIEEVNANGYNATRVTTALGKEVKF